MADEERLKLLEDRLTTIEQTLEEIKGLLSKQPSGKLPYDEQALLMAHAEATKPHGNKSAVKEYYLSHRRRDE